MIQLSLSAEDKLLVYCSRLDMGEDIKFKLEKILGNYLDWNYIVDRSTEQGILPLLYWNLSKICKGKNVPSEIMRSLENTYNSILAWNMLRYDELNRILTAFKKIGIDTIVLKGAFLAEEIYKNIGLRSMTDIDLLIKEEDLEKVKKEMIKLMYSVEKFAPTKLHERLETVLYNELQFFHTNKKISIEIHWNISNPAESYNVDIDKFWENAKPIKIADAETLMFTSEDLLQHLCLHLENHLNSNNPRAAKPFRCYCDIAAVTRHYKETINWKYLLQSTRSCGIEKPVFQSLFIANKCFGALVPKYVLSEFESVKSDTAPENIFREKIENNPNRKEDRLNAEIRLLSEYFKTLELAEGTLNKSPILFGDIFPYKEFMMHRYAIKNGKQVYLYYLIRSDTALQCELSISLGDINPSKELMVHRYTINNEKQVYLYHLIFSGTAFLRCGLVILWQLPYIVRSHI